MSEQNNANNTPTDQHPTATEQQPPNGNDNKQTPNENSSQNKGRGKGGRGGGNNRVRGGRGGNKGSAKSLNVEINDKGSADLCAKMIYEDPEDFLEIMQQDQESPLHPMKPFDQIIEDKDRKTPILQVLDDLDFFQPSKIQSQAIPILNDKEKKSDLIAQAQSGSGKTVAFLVSMLLHVDGEKKELQTICLCHTRELTMQTFKVFSDMNRYTKFEGDVCVKNDDSKEENGKPPSKTAQLLFGTPSSICHWIKQGELDVSHVNFLIIDEADAILDKTSTLFPSTKRLLKQYLPKGVQYGFFSATFKQSVVEYIKKKLRPNIITIRLRRNQQRVQTIDHWYTKVNNMDQAKDVIYDLVTTVSNGQTYVFTRSKKLVTEVSEFLNSKDVQCKAFSSDLKTDERDKTLDEFRNDEFKVLITSDVLARGIDIPNTYLVINLRTPIQIYEKKNRFQFNNTGNHQDNPKVTVPDCDTYYHRAGRAGRFGRSGLCFTIVLDERDENNLKLFCSEKNLNIPLNFIAKDEIANLPRERVTQTPQTQQGQPAESEPATQEDKA